MILITGGTGLVGSHLAYELVRKGQKVRMLLDKSDCKDSIYRLFKYYSPLEAEELFHSIDWVNGDILNRFVLNECLNNINTVYQINDYGSLGRKSCKQIRLKTVLGTSNLIDCCIEHKVSQFCYVGSNHCLSGLSNDLLIDESIFQKPGKNSGCFETSRFFGELEVWRGIEEGLSAVIVTPTIVLGPDFVNFHQSFLPGALNTEKGILFDGYYSFVDVRDLVQCMHELIEKECFGQRFIVSGWNANVKDLFSKVNSVKKRTALKNAYSFILKCLIKWIDRISIILPHRFSASSVIRRIAFKNACFSNEKIKKYLTFEFRSMNETITELDHFDNFIPQNIIRFEK